MSGGLKTVLSLIVATLVVVVKSIMGRKNINTDVVAYRKKYYHVAMSDGGMTEAKVIILFVIGIVIFAALIPTAISTIHAANVTGWSAAESSLWNIFGLIVIGVAVYKLIE